MKISVIIPTYNEEAAIGATLRHLQGCDCEVIVVDGGSVDATRKIVECTHDVQFLQSDLPGRAHQMNYGAARATGDVLLFLHADTEIHQKHLTAIHELLTSDRYAGGAFCIRFTGTGILLKLNVWASYMRSMLYKVYYGDQAIFVRTEVFKELNGYDVVPILEDGLFSRKLHRNRQTMLINMNVITSSRTIERHGELRTLSVYAVITTLFLIGFPPKKLAKIVHLWM